MQKETRETFFKRKAWEKTLDEQFSKTPPPFPRVIFLSHCTSRSEGGRNKEGAFWEAGLRMGNGGKRRGIGGCFWEEI